MLRSSFWLVCDVLTVQRLLGYVVMEAEGASLPSNHPLSACPLLCHCQTGA